MHICKSVCLQISDSIKYISVSKPSQLVTDVTDYVEFM